jgi:ribonuclease-3
MTPQRLRQLADLLRRLQLDPAASDGPGATAAALAPVDEALSHTSAGLVHNHERLEFLGDAVLRLAAAVFLQRLDPRPSVGECSALRAQIVSDRWLSELAAQCGLESAVRLGPLASGDRAGRATVLAECCEALVGGVYEAWGGTHGGLDAVGRWLEPHWRQAVADLQADPHRHNWKSALQEWSQGLGLGLPHYQCEERSRRHGDPQRFQALVQVLQGAEPVLVGEGWGGSRREAEQQAARQALEALPAPEDVRPAPGS